MSMQDVFFPLYKKSSTGKLLVWSIAVEGSTIVETWGQVDGKLQSTSDTITEGKNLGKVNETTPEEQARLEAKSKWEKKLKGHNYTESAKDAMAGVSSDKVEGGILPMLAHKYSESGDKIVFPAACQPKLDGHRCIAVIDDKGKATLWSRTRKPILSAAHVIDALERLQLQSVVLDGELYNHAYHNNFDELSHFIRQVKTIPGCEAIQYHVYDTVSAAPFRERIASVHMMLGSAPKCLVAVETIAVDDADDLMLAFEHFKGLGYEGCMVRNTAGLYVNKRSYDLQKVKEFDDAEYKVVGVSEGRGKLTGHAIFNCQTENGTRFDVKLKGDTKELAKYWKDPSLCMHKLLTVQYQGLTGKNKVPRFPVGVRLRDDN